MWRAGFLLIVCGALVVRCATIEVDGLQFDADKLQALLGLNSKPRKEGGAQAVRSTGNAQRRDSDQASAPSALDSSLQLAASLLGGQQGVRNACWGWGMCAPQAVPGEPLIVRTRKLVDAFLAAFGAQFSHPAIDAECTRKCGLEWLKCFDLPNCQSVSAAVPDCSCQNFTFAQFPAAELKQILKRHGVTDEDRQQLRENPYMSSVIMSAFERGLSSFDYEALLFNVVDAAYVAVNSSSKLNQLHRLNANSTVPLFRTDGTYDTLDGDKPICWLSIGGLERKDWVSTLNVSTSQWLVRRKTFNIQAAFATYANEVEKHPDFVKWLNIDSTQCKKFLVGHSAGAAVAHVLSARYQTIDSVFLFGLPNVASAQADETPLPRTLSLVHSGDPIQAIPTTMTHISSARFYPIKYAFHVSINSDTQLFAALSVLFTASTVLAGFGFTKQIQITPPSVVTACIVAAAWWAGPAIALPVRDVLVRITGATEPMSQLMQWLIWAGEWLVWSAASATVWWIVRIVQRSLVHENYQAILNVRSFPLFAAAALSGGLAFWYLHTIRANALAAVMNHDMGHYAYSSLQLRLCNDRMTSDSWPVFKARYAKVYDAIASKDANPDSADTIQSRDNEVRLSNFFTLTHYDAARCY